MRKILSLLFVLFPLWAIAQEDTDFTADRPGATTGVDVLSKGRLQWETGVAFEHSGLDNPSSTTWTINTSLIRWGFSDLAELRLQADYLYTLCNGNRFDGFSNVAIGTKVRLMEGGDVIPAVSLLANIYLSGGAKSTFLPRNCGGQMGLLFQNQITQWFSLGYEGDLIWLDSGRPTVFFGLCLGFSITERLSLGVEEYNYNTGDGTECWSEISLAWQLSSRLQIDLGTDISLQKPGKYHNMMLGVTWQIR